MADVKIEERIRKHRPSGIPAKKFAMVFLSTFGLFYGFNIAFIGLTSPGGYYIAFLDHNLNYITAWRDFNILFSATFLKLLGYKVFYNHTTLNVYNHAGFNLVYSCLGYGMMSVFAAFVISFPNSAKLKTVILIAGILIIQVLNLIRLICIALYWNKEGLIYNIDHHDLFNGCLFIILGFMLYLWNNTLIKHAKNTT